MAAGSIEGGKATPDEIEGVTLEVLEEQRMRRALLDSIKGSQQELNELRTRLAQFGVEGEKINECGVEAVYYLFQNRIVEHWRRLCDYSFDSRAGCRKKRLELFYKVRATAYPTKRTFVKGDFTPKRKFPR